MPVAFIVSDEKLKLPIQKLNNVLLIPTPPHYLTDPKNKINFI